jgi:hypothetical protein
VIAEPMTVLTDYALAAVSVWLALRSVKYSRYWALAFFALATAALLGGTWHGFVKSHLLWKATTLSVGVASFGMVVGSALAATSGIALRLLVGFAAIKLLAYTVWMLGHDDFIWVIADTASALLIVGVLHAWRLNGWMLAGVAVSILAGLAQASGLALHQHFNHNDLYHVIQIGALLLFYRGISQFS